jgi:uncharacterized protein (DUF885 family)
MSTDRPSTHLATTDGHATTAVTALADEFWAYYQDVSQLINLQRGDVRFIDRWDDFSHDSVQSYQQRFASFADHAEESLADGNGADQSAQAMLSAIAFTARSDTVMLPYFRDLGQLSGTWNITTDLSVFVPNYMLTTASHGAGYIRRLTTFPAYIDRFIDGVRAGVSEGRASTQRGIAATITDLTVYIDRPVADDPLLRQSPPQELSPEESDQWREHVADAVATHVRPALAKLRTTLRDEILRLASRDDDRPGICYNPGGADDYESLLWAFTSTRLSSDAIHELGLEQLASLDDEFRRRGAAAFGTSDPAVLRARLRTDPTLRYDTAEDLITDATRALDRARHEARNWFSRLPTADCVPIAVQTGAVAYYSPPSPDGKRGGNFFFNISDPSAWARTDLEAITFHESVPGHHLQLALASELGLHPVLSELPMIAYAEGWGLYAERLADEMSLYSGPLQRLGMVEADTLRAARLVVDTGLHARGWSRIRAIDYLGSRVSMDRRLVEAEIDRYIAWPGQATAYMIGRLEIEQLRRGAQQHLGQRFSISEFHDAVLGQGMCTLPELARRIEFWQASKLAATPSEPVTT